VLFSSAWTRLEATRLGWWYKTRPSTGILASSICRDARGDHPGKPTPLCLHHAPVGASGRRWSEKCATRSGSLPPATIGLRTCAPEVATWPCVEAWSFIPCIRPFSSNWAIFWAALYHQLLFQSRRATLKKFHFLFQELRAVPASGLPTFEDVRLVRIKDASSIGWLAAQSRGLSLEKLPHRVTRQFQAPRNLSASRSVVDGACGQLHNEHSDSSG
jgi:hypothetical protein